MVFHATADDAIVVDPFLLAFLSGATPFLAVIQSAAKDLSSIAAKASSLQTPAAT
jgi:hypothetical protein